MRRILLALLAAVLLGYAADWIALHFRSPQTSQIVIKQYYAVALKGGKREEYMPLDPTTETCTHSLFPQMGDLPCWYLNRHKLRRIDIP